MKMQTNNLHVERAKREKTCTSSCLHCWSVFYSFDSVNADWLQHAYLRASVDFSAFVLSSKRWQDMCLSLKAPRKEPVHYPNILTLNCGLIYGFKHWELPVHLRKTNLNHFISFHFHLLCFLLSSSPSLDHTLSWLKEQRRKLVIQI